MSYAITQQDDDHAYGLISAVVNTRADILTLPINWTSGSNCLCIEDSSVWMLTVETDDGIKIWKEI